MDAPDIYVRFCNYMLNDGECLHAHMSSPHRVSRIVPACVRLPCQSLVGATGWIPICTMVVCPRWCVRAGVFLLDETLRLLPEVKEHERKRENHAAW